MRCFVAVVPPPEATEHLDEFLDVRRAAAPFRWTLPEQVHVTLAFLGHVSDHHLDELGERLTRAAARRRRFETRITGGGAFPHVAGARVLWAGLELDEATRLELRRLAEGSRAAATRTGIEVDGQRFRPHLTVARMGRPVLVTSWIGVLESYAGPAWPVETITLLQSHLGQGPGGRPRYDVLGEFPLG